jgi:hypothetical protein
LLYPTEYQRLQANSFRADFTTISCTQNAKTFCHPLINYQTPFNVDIYEIPIAANPNQTPDLLRSDHIAFVNMGLPAGMLTDTADYRNPNYHQATDTLDTLNIAFITQQANAVVAWLDGMNTTSVTGTPAPTATNAQSLNLTLFLHGIGKSGDNSNPTATGNLNPLHPQRTATVEFYNSSNILTGTKFSTLNFQLSTGSFTGTVDVSSLPSGVYTAKVKVSQYLKKGIPGIITLPAIASATVGPISFTTGDANNDNTLSILDYNLLLDCFSDLTPAKNCTDPTKKTATDLTDDGAVNQFDYNLFLRELSVQSGE